MLEPVPLAPPPIVPLDEPPTPLELEGLVVVLPVPEELVPAELPVPELEEPVPLVLEPALEPCCFSQSLFARPVSVLQSVVVLAPLELLGLDELGLEELLELLGLELAPAELLGLEYVDPVPDELPLGLVLDDELGLDMLPVPAEEPVLPVPELDPAAKA